MCETWVQSLGGEDPLEEEMATHSSMLAWRVLMDRGAWWATVRGVAESRTRVSTHSRREENVKTSLAAQWLRLCTANAEGMISTPGQGTQTRHATEHSQRKVPRNRSQLLRDVFPDALVLSLDS